MSEIARSVVLTLMAIGCFALQYWVMRVAWGANTSIAAGIAAVMALMIWLPIAVNR